MYALRNETPVTVVDASQFFEVSASMEPSAEVELATTPSKALNVSDVRFYGSSSFKCIDSAFPYLVRAVYVNGGTGRFKVSTYGTTLSITHDSMGKPTEMHRTALVVCLSSKTRPTTVYHSIVGAI